MTTFTTDIEQFIDNMLKGTNVTQAEKDAIVLKWALERESKDKIIDGLQKANKILSIST